MEPERYLFVLNDFIIHVVFTYSYVIVTKPGVAINIQFFQNGVLLKLVFWYTYSVANVLNQKYLKMCIQQVSLWIVLCAKHEFYQKFYKYFSNSRWTIIAIFLFYWTDYSYTETKSIRRKVNHHVNVLNFIVINGKFSWYFTLPNYYIIKTHARMPPHVRLDEEVHIFTYILDILEVNNISSFSVTTTTPPTV